MSLQRATRRSFLGAAVATAAAAQSQFVFKTAQTALPRWRGFNLLDMFQAFSKQDRKSLLTSEDELRWIRDWGFNFVRFPMDYWLWVDSDWRKTRKLDPEDVMKINEAALEPVDRMVELGRKFGLHVSLNFHRAPGYCVNNAEREPYILWLDSRAEDAFVYHWDFFAKRYRGVSEFDLSFNLLNEAPRQRADYMTREDYRRVMTMAVNKIRETSPRRVILIDGLDVGNSVVEEMIPTGVAQSLHAYWPGGLTHYRAAWVDRKGDFPEPTWPMKKPDGTVVASREILEKRLAPWGELAKKGIGVHCGECGCHNKTPHGVFLAWLTDVLEVLEGYGIGWALWNLKGSFGVLDSGRADVEYEDWYGHKLDRKLLHLMQRY